MTEMMNDNGGTTRRSRNRLMGAVSEWMSLQWPVFAIAVFSLLFSMSEASDAGLEEEGLPERRWDLLEIIALSTFYQREALWDEFDLIVPDVRYYVREHPALPVSLIRYAIEARDESLFWFAFDSMDFAEALYYFTDRENERAFAGILLRGIRDFGLEEDIREQLLADAHGFNREGEWILSSILYNAVLEKDPNNGAALMGLGTIALRSGDRERGKELLLDSWNNGEIGALGWYLYILLEEDDLEEAETLIPAAKEGFEKDANIQFMMLAAAVKLKDANLFLWAYQNANFEVILSRDVLPRRMDEVILEGLELYGDEEMIEDFQRRMMKLSR